MAAIVRVNEKTRWISVLCPMGHVVAGHKSDHTFGGSMFAADLAQVGRPGSAFDRMAAECDGHGHSAR